MGIGIDETTYTNKHHGRFASAICKSTSYALWHDGYKTRRDYNTLSYRTASRFNTNNTVTMILDLSLRTLSYKMNNGNVQIVFKKIRTAKNINYCMGVYIDSRGDSIALMR